MRALCNQNGFAATIVLLFSVWATAEQPVGVYIFADSFTYNNAAPIKQIFDDLQGAPVGRGDVAFTFNKIEVGQDFGSYSIAVFSRYDYLLEFTPDTIELMHLDKNNLPIPAGRSFNVNLQANGIRASGIGITEYFNYQAFVFAARVNFIRANLLTQGELSGNLQTSTDIGGNFDFEGSLALDYAYTEDLLLAREPVKQRGKGFSLDLDIDWQINPQWRMALITKDLVSRIRWQDATFTRATATTNQLQFDSEGRIDAVPAVSGIESFNDHYQTLPKRGNFIVEHQTTNRLSTRFDWFRYDDYNLPSLGFVYKLRQAQIQLDYQLESESLKIGFANRFFAFSLQSDRLNWRHAKTLGLHITLGNNFD